MRSIFKEKKKSTTGISIMAQLGMKSDDFICGPKLVGGRLSQIPPSLWSCRSSADLRRETVFS